MHDNQDNQRMVRLADDLHQHMAQYGYVIVKTPIIQAADLFLTRAGDQIVTRLFTFDHYGQLLALRPEFTATAAHYYATQNQGENPVVRWQFSGSIFEDDPSRDRRDHQFFSIGAELIGLGGALAEAEIIGMAYKGVERRGVRNLQIALGHVGLMRRLLGRFNLDSRTEHFLLNHLADLKNPQRGRDYVLEQTFRLLLGRTDANAIEQLEREASDETTELNTQQMLDIFLDATHRSATMGGRTRHDIVRRLLQKRKRATERQQIIEALDFLTEWVKISAPPDDAFAQIAGLIAAGDFEMEMILANWRETIDLLAAYEISPEQLRIEPGLARSWDYYTGAVFELYTDAGAHLAGGGRYDELVQLVGGNQDVPAVGFVYYPDAISAAEVEIGASGPPIPVTIMVEPETQAAGIQWAQQLRSNGLMTTVMPAGQASSNGGLNLTLAGTDSIQLDNDVYTRAEIDQLIWNLQLRQNYE